MKLFGIIFIILFSINTVSSQKKNEVIGFGFKKVIKSKILKENREIWIALPELYNENKQYPVLYLLDGDAHFYSVSGMVRQLSMINGNTTIPEMIVVGILNINRTKDLTPYKGDIDNPIVSEGFIVEPGALKFEEFLEKELIPHIESNYKTNPYRILVGHSFGGLLGLHILMKKPHLFNSIIAIDPSVWWGKNQLLFDLKKEIPKLDLSGKSLFLGIANTFTEKESFKEILKDSTAYSGHLRAIIQTDQFFQKVKGLRYSSKFYKNDTHGSVPLISEYDGLRFLFDYYSFSLTMKEYFHPPMDLFAKIDSHYKKVSKEMTYPVLPNEDWINSLGYQFLGVDKPEIAKDFFKMNIENYPKSANVYDSYGDYFMAIKDEKLALEQYEKAYEINQDPTYKQRLDKMRK